jgi:hypothetical protein
MEETITYFEKPGKQNTEAVLALVHKRAKASGITHVVVPSSSGATGLAVTEMFKGSGTKVVVVTLHAGFSKEGENRFLSENRQKVVAAGAQIVTGAHPLSGLERSMSRKFEGVSRTEVIAASLKSLFGHGMKVCVECVLMAADGGAIPVGPDIEILALGGRSSGVDTAVIMRPAHVNNFFATEIREVIAMPRLKHRAYKIKEGN